MHRPFASKTPKQIYDVFQLEDAIELLPEGKLKEKGDLAPLRNLAEMLQAVHIVANRKSLRR